MTLGKLSREQHCKRNWRNGNMHYAWMTDSRTSLRASKLEIQISNHSGDHMRGDNSVERVDTSMKGTVGGEGIVTG
jgi:hypothetical protein